MYVLRSLFTAAALLAALLAFWYPADSLVQVEPVDWGERYERAYVPRSHLWGAMEMAAEMRRASRPVVPLATYIAQETEGRLRAVDGPQWVRLAEEVAAGRIWFEADSIPLAVAAGGNHLALQRGDQVEFLHLSVHAPDGYPWDEIPGALLHPLRSGTAPALFAGFLLLYAVGRFGHRDRVWSSTAGGGVRAGAVLLLAGLALGGAPFLYRVEEWAPPAAIVGLLLVLTGLVTALMFVRHVRWLRRLLAGEGLLAHWDFPAREWQAYAERAFAARASGNLALLAVVAFFVLLIGGGFALFAPDREAGLTVAGVLLGVLALVTVVAVAAPRMGRRFLLRHPAEVWIGEDGVYVGGAVHLWRGLSARLESVERDGRDIRLVYSFLQAMGGRFLYVYRRYETVLLPVPAEREGEAEAVVARLTGARGSSSGPDTESHA